MKKLAALIPAILGLAFTANTGTFDARQPLPERETAITHISRINSECNELKSKIEKYLGKEKNNAGIYIKALNSDFEVDINASKVFPIASTIKLGILMNAIKQSEEKKLNLNEIESDLSKMIIESDNEATNRIIEKTNGLKTTNEYLQSIGIFNTKLQRIMLNKQAVKEGKDNLGTAKDLSTMLEKIYYSEGFREESSSHMLSLLLKEKWDYLIKAGVPFEVPVAKKIGEISRKEGYPYDLEANAGIVFSPKHPFIITAIIQDKLPDFEGQKIVDENSASAKAISDITKMTYEFLEN